MDQGWPFSIVIIQYKLINISKIVTNHQSSFFVTGDQFYQDKSQIFLLLASVRMYM